MQPKLPKNFWSGFWVMVIAYSLVRLFFYEPVVRMPAWVYQQRQFFRWINISFVYVVGIFVVGRMKVEIGRAHV